MQSQHALELTSSKLSQQLASCKWDEQRKDYNLLVLLAVKVRIWHARNLGENTTYDKS